MTPAPDPATPSDAEPTDALEGLAASAARFSSLMDQELEKLAAARDRVVASARRKAQGVVEEAIQEAEAILVRADHQAEATMSKADASAVEITSAAREYTEQLGGINAQYRAALEIALQALKGLPAIPPPFEVQPESELPGHDHTAVLVRSQDRKLSHQTFASDLSPDHDMSEASQMGRSVISIAIEQARSASRRQLSHQT